MLEQALISRLREALRDATTWLDVHTRLQELAPDDEDPLDRAFLDAFGYALIERSYDAARDREGGPFGAMFSGDGWQVPPRLTDVQPEAVAAWRDAADALDEPLAVSRLGDLLWEVKSKPRPDLRARAASDAYRVLANEDARPPIERVRYLTRGLELACAIGDVDRQAGLIDDICGAVRSDLESDDGGAGVSLLLLSALVDLSAEARPAETDQLLVRANATYGDNPHIADGVADLRARLLPTTEREPLRRAQVERWRTAAGDADGILRVIHLEHALDLARTHGLADLVQEIRRELQNIPAEALDLKAVSAEVEMTAAEVEAFRAAFRAGTWEDAMRRFGAQGPPGGEPADLEEHVDRVMRDYPLQFLFTKAIVGPDRATAIFRATGQDSHRRLAISQHRAESARFWGIFAAEVRDIVREHHGVPNHQALALFFTTSLIDVEVADRIARAVELHWSGDYDESTHLLTPRLETVLREAARRVGIPIIREPIGVETGGVRGLGAILRDLGGAFRHAGWHAYLENLLTDQLGLNLRNAVAHGLRPQFTKVDSALLIHAACYLRLLGLEPIEPETPG